MTDNIDAIIAQEEQLLKVSVAKTMGAYQRETTVVNLREMQGAKRALDDFQRRQRAETEGPRFRNLVEVARWLITEGYKVQERTVRNHQKAGFFPAQPGGEYRQSDIEAYAKAHLDRPGYTRQGPVTANNYRDRLTEAMARDRELIVAQREGKLIDAAEEEARDAKLWRAVRADIETHAPGVINELVERVSAATLDLGLKQRIAAMIPELRAGYEDFLAEMFDRYSQQGGMDVDK
jgi:hypothetical protein